jgi:tetratricopeptide (TPR) repeat protein
MKKTFVLLFLFATAFGFAQKENTADVDSLLLRGRYQQVLSLLKEAPDSFKKFSTMGNVYYQIDKTQLAIDYYVQALEKEDDYKTQVQLGKAYQKVRGYDEAIAVFEDILEKDPDNLLIKFQLGKLYLKKRKANKAIKTFTELMAVDQTNPNYAYQKGIAYAMKKDRNAMIDSFLEAYETDSMHVKSLYQLSNSFFKLKDKDSTNLFLQKGLALDPTHINMNRLLVNQTFREKRYDETLKALQRLDSITPNEIFVLNMFGRTYYNMNQHEKSKEYFTESKDKDSNDFKTWTYLGHNEMKLGHYKMAELNYRMATFIGKDKLDEEYYGLGHAYLKQAKPLEAIAMFDKAYKEDRGNYKALYQKAKTTDDYYKEKNKAYKLYDQYMLQFENMDKDLTAYVQRRIAEIKKEYFMKGEALEE